MIIRDSAKSGDAAPPAGKSPDVLQALYALPVGTLPNRAPRSTTPCPICRGVLATDRYAVATEEPRADGLYTVIDCSACGHGRLDPMPAPDAIRAFYPDHYYGTPGQKFRPIIEAVVRYVGRRHVRFLIRGLAPGARVLDIGCGRGVLLGPLADEGMSVHGFELSEEACRGADSRAEIRVGEELRAAGYADDAFDLIVIWHVLEHLADPRATLEEIHRILRPGGRFVVAVPNYGSWQARWSGAGWFHLDLPRHLHHFTAPGLAELLQELGFKPRSTHHFSLRQNPFGWIQSALNRIPSLPRNYLYALLHQPAEANHAQHQPSRLLQFALFALLSPLAILLTLAETAARKGGTVHIVAECGENGETGDAPTPKR